MSKRFYLFHGMKRLGLVLLVLALAVLACNFPGASAPTPTLSKTGKTASVVSNKPTAISPSGVATAIPPTAVSTTVVTSTATRPPASVTPPPPMLTPTQTVTQKPASIYRGLFVYEKGNFIGYTLDGKPLNLSRSAPGIDYVGMNHTQVVGEDVVYINDDDNLVYRSTAKGIQKLAFIPSDIGKKIAVSLDGKLIAWSHSDWTQFYPGGEIWIANIDGSSTRSVVKLEPKNNPNYVMIYPLRWTVDGKLLYVQEPTGIGGYILFNMHASIHLFDPVANKTTDLVPFDKNNNFCVDGISDDLSKAVFHCYNGKVQMAVRVLSSGKTTVIPPFVEQNQAGSGKFSPSGAWLAYGAARGDPDNEMGHAVLAASDGSGQQKELAAMKDIVLQVIGWLDEDTILLQGYADNVSSIYVVKRAEQGARLLVNGEFAGFLK